MASARKKKAATRHNVSKRHGKPHHPSRPPSKPSNPTAKADRSKSKSTTTSSTPIADPYDPRATIPFDLTSDSILLIGDGDLSFAHSLVVHHYAPSVTATVYDSQPDLERKYPDAAAANATAILEADPDSRILYSVDATALRKVKALKAASFDRVVFNFPHVGGVSTDVNRQVRANQALLVGFFGEVKGLLTEEGTVIVTLFEGEPYTLWNVRDLARHAGLEVVRSFRFDAGVYPGYSHARTLGRVQGGGGWKGEDRESRSYVFRVKDSGKESTGAQSNLKKRKRSTDNSSDDEH